MPPIRHPLSQGRWHFQHGPIDLVIGAEGTPQAVLEAHEAAWSRFQPLLSELVRELPLLRQPVAADDESCPLQGPVARRMWWACHPHRHQFITPMAAVAGAVAQEILAAYAREGVDRAWVNNGGDIALHLAYGHALRVGVVADPVRAHAAGPGSATAIDGRFEVSNAMPVRGVATSGWRGRSFSLGIADSVTVLAGTADAADAAATVIANAVNADDQRIVRRPACALKDDSDLGDMAVTVDVPPLPAFVVQHALQGGARRARELRARGIIEGALLVCQGQVLVVGDLALAGVVPSPVSPGSAASSDRACASQPGGPMAAMAAMADARSVLA